MTRTLLSSLALAAILAMTAGDAAPADAAEKRAKAQRGTQKSKPKMIDVLSFSWGATASSPKKKLKAKAKRPGGHLSQ